MTLPVQRALTEDAILTIREIVNLAERRSVADLDWVPRFEGGPTSRVSRHADLQLSYLRVVSIVELFIDSLSRELWAERPEKTEVFRILAVEAQADSENTWTSRKESMRKYHKIDLGSAVGWNQIDAAVVVRNAIAHGVGALTHRQRNLKSRQKIRAVGVEIVDGAVHVKISSLQQLRGASVDFLTDVDKRSR